MSSFLVVFMGSEKYPDENAFDAFIKKHGGSDNASTDCEMVCPAKTFHNTVQLILTNKFRNSRTTEC